MCDDNRFAARPVCVFDSGTGGLNLLAACAERCPGTDFIYFADNYNMPYGSLPPEKVKELVFDAFARIARRNPLAAVVACNTATALCINDLREKYDFPVIGIQPAIKPAVSIGGKCLVLATPATVASRSFTELCRQYGDGAVEAVACPGLAAYIEEHIAEYPDFDVSQFLPACNPASVVLGCTHYVFAEKAISKIYSCPAFDGISGTADHLRTLLGIKAKNRLKKQKIEFKNGDFEKNSKIYSLIIDYKNKNKNVNF